MTGVNALQLIGLIPVGALFGNELGTLLIHGSFFNLPTDAHLAVEQAVQRALGRVMPFYVILAIAGSVALTVAANGTGAWLSGIGTACLVAMLAITLTSNVPINNATVKLQPGVDADHWRRLRTRWTRLHVVRVTLDGAAFLLACLSIAAGD